MPLKKYLMTSSKNSKSLCGKNLKIIVKAFELSIMYLFLEHVFNVILGDSEVNLNLNNNKDYVEITLNNDTYAMNFIMKKEKIISEKRKNKNIKTPKTRKAFRIDE